MEVLVASAVLAVILVLVTNMIGRTGAIWTSYRDRATAFESASAAFERMTKTLAQATLNTYWQVTPTGSYGRNSELHFVMGRGTDLLPPAAGPYFGDTVFFQAPLGRSTSVALQKLPGLLNSVGYYLTFNATPVMPDFLKEPDVKVENAPRFRLYEWLEATESNSVYSTDPVANPGNWFLKDFSSAPAANAYVLAENVLGIVMLAEYPNAAGATLTEFDYDSRDASRPQTLHQLPPTIRIAMVVLDEGSAVRLATLHGNSPPPVTAQPTWFTNPDNFDDDLKSWEDALVASSLQLNFRIFHATISIHNAKWSL